MNSSSKGFHVHQHVVNGVTAKTASQVNLQQPSDKGRQSQATFESIKRHSKKGSMELLQHSINLGLLNSHSQSNMVSNPSRGPDLN